MAHPGGRPRRFSSPDELLEAFEEYKQWASEHPWNKKEAIKSGDMAGTLIDIPTEMPLTEWGFAAFCKTSRSTLIEYGNREEFSYIYASIKDEMAAQRISGGMSGAYNANLVARIDGLTEKSEVDNNHHFPDKIKINFVNDDE
jgi:hypothetical protein